MKSSLATATSAYESVTKAARQATDVAESNLNAVTNATLKAANDAAQASAKAAPRAKRAAANRSEEHTSELQSLMRISYAVFCLKKKKKYTAYKRKQYHKSTTMQTQ